MFSDGVSIRPHCLFSALIAVVAIAVLGSTLPDFKSAFGTKEAVYPVRHLIGTALGWGGDADKDATYLNITPTKNDGGTVYKLKRLKLYRPALPSAPGNSGRQMEVP
jgi:hypothetical protein